MKKLVILLLLSGCATVPAPITPDCTDNGFSLVNASAWFATAAEYDANALQTYNTARRLLDAALETPGGKPAAIITDLDETAIDNAAFEGRMIRQGRTYDQKAWGAWVNESAAVAIPGAAEFLNYARSRGVTPFYVTNRLAAEEPGTLRNLQRIGFPFDPAQDTLLVRGERPEWQPSDKGPRRDYVASRYRVLLTLGDDLNDFVNAHDKTREERDALVRSNADKWGSTWLILPNPMYGSWERALTRGSTTPCEELQKKIDAIP